MIIIETCPKCGHDLQDLVVATNPPIPKKECFNCGWVWEGEPEQVVRIPFGGNSFNHDDPTLHGNTDCECLNSTDCFANNLAGRVFMSNVITHENAVKLSHDDIAAAVERTKKYIKR